MEPLVHPPHPPVPSRRTPWGRANRPERGLGGLFCLLFLALIVLVPFREVLFQGRMFFFADIATQNYPWKVFFAEHIRHFSLPLWFPYMHSGFPLVAEIQAGTFYPPNWIAFLLLPAPYAYGLLMALHLWLAAVFTYFFSRALGLGRASSLFAALTLSLSAFLVTHLVHLAMFLTACWLPLEFFLMERALRRQSPRLLFLSLGPAVALQVLAGHPQIVAYSGLALSLYLCAHLTRKAGKGRRTPGLRMAGAWLAALCLSGLLSAVQLLPTLELVGESARAGGVGPEFASEQSMPPWGLVTILLPDFFGYATPQEEGDFWLFGVNYWEMCPYAGVLTLVLCLVPLSRRPLGRWAFFYVLLGFSLLLMLGRTTPLFPLLQRLPPFSYFRAPVRFSLLASFSLAMLAGRGLQILQDGKAAGRGDPRKAAFTLAAAGFFLTLATLGAGTLALRVFDDSIRNGLAGFGTAFIQKHIHNQGLFVKPLEYYLGKLDWAVDTLLLRLRDSLDPSEPRVFLCLALLAATALLLRRLERGRLSAGRFSLLCVCLLLVDLLAFGLRYNPTIPVSEALGPPAVVEFLRGDPDRYRVFQDVRCRRMEISREKELLPVSMGSLWGISSADEFTPLKLKHYQEILSLIKQDRELLLHGRISRLPLLSLLNVKYLLTHLPIQGDGLTEVHRTGDFRVYRNETVLPRCFFVSEWRVVSEPGALVRALSDPALDLTRQALLEEAPAAVSRPADAPPGAVPAASIRFRHEEAERVELEAVVGEEGLLILAVSWYPGWQAWVDGNPAKIYRADSVYQGVFLAPGTHTIRFQYLPVRLREGAVLSAAGWGCWAAAGLGLALRGRRRRSCRPGAG